MVKSGGLPVTYTNDPAVDASAIRMVDLEKKFYRGPYELADAAGCNNHGSTGNPAYSIPSYWSSLPGRRQHPCQRC